MSTQVDKSFDARRILTEVEQHQPFDSLESEHKNSLLKWLKTASRPLDANYFDELGHATGSAFIVSKSSQEVLLVYHKKLCRWLQPGGHAEPGEQELLTTALREAQEETGLELNFDNAFLLDLDVHKIPQFKNQPSHLHFDFRYLFLSDVALPLKVGSDVRLARWFKSEEMEKMELDVSIQRMITKCKFLGLL